jgi:hypothetical protein
MKMGKWLIVLLVAALVAAYAFTGSDYLKQRHQHNSLTADIAAAQSSLAAIPPTPSDLAAKLAAAQADLAAAETAFTADTDSTHIVNAVLKTAVDSEVSAIPLGTQDWVQEIIAGRTYNVFNLNLQASGSFAQVKDFISRLESGSLKTLVIKGITVDKTAIADALVVANVQVAVYALPPQP